MLLLIRLVEKVLPTLSGTWSLSTWGRSRTRARRRGQWAMMRMEWGQCPRCRSLSWPVSMVINSPCLNSWIKVRGFILNWNLKYNSNTFSLQEWRDDVKSISTRKVWWKTRTQASCWEDDSGLTLMTQISNHQLIFQVDIPKLNIHQQFVDNNELDESEDSVRTVKRNVGKIFLTNLSHNMIHRLE